MRVLLSARSATFPRPAPQASSSQWEVRDEVLRAVVACLPRLRRLRLWSYDVSRDGLLALAGLGQMRELVLDMEVWYGVVRRGGEARQRCLC